MPHHRKYVPHSGGIVACPSRANRSIVSNASQGFSSRLSRSVRSALLSFRSLTLVYAKKQKPDGGSSPLVRLLSSSATYRLGVASLTPPRTAAVPQPTIYSARTLQRRGRSRIPLSRSRCE